MFKTIKNQIIMLRTRFRLRGSQVVLGFWTELGNCTFSGSANIEPFCRFYGTPKIKIGDRFYANAYCHFLGDIEIGNDVLIGPKVVIWGRDHGTSRTSCINKQPHVIEKITIGDDVWVGANVTILKGVSIGTGAVIAAGSVVVKSVASYSIVAGCPARHIKFRS